jgi:two-component system, NarL family, nitrate/nitrite response regulator NarL
MARDAVHSPELTPREREILLLSADGRSAPDIALHLQLSPSAVKMDLLSSFEKLGVRDRAGAVAMALETGLLGERV